MTNPKKRYLTKSRYKLGLECPNKLYYTNKKDYANAKMNDPFLQALASGGFQVEELARMHYPDGILIEDKKSDETYDYQDKVDQTIELLENNEDVVIFEAAFLYQNLFIRVDILEKKGDQINLIEVKAKSFDSTNAEFEFVGKRGGLDSNWKFYLFDVSFQKYVINKAFPQYTVKPFLMLADKSQTTTINGLNQLFRITKNNDNRTGVERKIDQLKNIEAESVLGIADISNEVRGIESGRHRIIEDYDFEDGIQIFAKAYQEDRYLGHDLNFNVCKHCEFKTDKQNKDEKKSGFEECFKMQLNWKEKDFKQPTAFEISRLHFSKLNKFNELGILKLEDIEDVELLPKKESAPVMNGMSTSERQLIQKHKALEKDFTPVVLKDELKAEINSWTFPLNFIDFEASTMALPFYKGQSPYEKVVFQFSVHTYQENGTIEHADEYINVQPGEFPNFEFVRQLKKALEKNKGTVFQFSPYENSTLNQIKAQLENSDEADKEKLINFIQTLTTPPTSKSYEGELWNPTRGMVDLCEVVKAYYYNPHTKGSNSIKAILPAVFESSKLIKEKYTRPIKEINMTSKNFEDDYIWLKQNDDNTIEDPYKSLKPPFEDWDPEFERKSEIEEINNGGAALTAYGLTQYTDMGNEERKEIKNALLRYCELDTLAMVIVYEHLVEVSQDDFI
ncbi:DUF2779 domain-containing protein [Psychroflexus tropicus]|uniref:DUF2779 domain-containing protein n=1 Tax=Psychroflexus tropicus TaxID=197345 RepID=UPI0003651F54|nr:DUF2779 domain-containing protein [Psychroflexus tropicus]